MPALKKENEDQERDEYMGMDEGENQWSNKISNELTIVGKRIFISPAWTKDSCWWSLIND